MNQINDKPTDDGKYKIIYVQGQNLIHPKDVITDIEQDKYTGVSIKYILAPENLGVVSAEMRSAIADKRQPIIALEGHGDFSENPKLLEHSIGLFKNDISQKTASTIKNIVDDYRKLAPNGPKLLVAVSSCSSEGLIKSLPKDILKYCDVLMDDSQHLLTMVNDVTSFIHDAAMGKNARTTFLYNFSDDKYKHRNIGISALVTEKGVLDGEEMFKKITPENFDKLKSKAIEAFSKDEFKSLPQNLQDNIKSAVNDLTVDDLKSKNKIRHAVFMSYFSMEESERYIPLEKYTGQINDLKKFWNPRTSDKEALDIASKMDANVVNNLVSTFNFNFDDNSKYNVEKFKLLMKAGANPFVELFSNLTEEHFEKVLRFSIENGANINAQNADGTPPLVLATRTEYNSAAKYLLEQGADVNARNRHGMTALHEASNNQYNNIIVDLIKYGADINATDKIGRTPLHIYGKALEDLTILISKGANVNARDKDVDTPLMMYVGNYNTRELELLINNGAEINYKNKEGTSPLSASCKNGEFTGAKLLIDSGAIIDQESIDQIKNFIGNKDTGQEDKKQAEKFLKFMEEKKVSQEKLIKQDIGVTIQDFQKSGGSISYEELNIIKGLAEIKGLKDISYVDNSGKNDKIMSGNTTYNVTLPDPQNQKIGK